MEKLDELGDQITEDSSNALNLDTKGTSEFVDIPHEETIRTIDSSSHHKAPSQDMRTDFERKANVSVSLNFFSPPDTQPHRG